MVQALYSPSSSSVSRSGVDLPHRPLTVQEIESMVEGLFLAASARDILPNRPALVGFPLDRTCTYRSGVGLAPSAIRRASNSIESYSPFLDRDLLDCPFADLGDLGLESAHLDRSLRDIEERVNQVVEGIGVPVCMGGEHTITLPIVTVLHRSHPDMVVIHLDAHADLRDQYEGSPINHATVMRRVCDVVGGESLVQLGIRAGTRAEFRWMKENGTLLEWGPGAEKNLFRRTEDRPIYLSLDLDVLDPAALPGTGNPEAGGWTYQDMERFLWCINRFNLIGADVVELNPDLDQSEMSSITSAKILRELLLATGGDLFHVNS